MKILHFEAYNDSKIWLETFLRSNSRLQTNGWSLISKEGWKMLMFMLVCGLRGVWSAAFMY